MKIFTFTKLGRALLLAVVAAIGVAGLSGCGGGGNKPSELVGHWVHYEGDTRGKPEDIELFKDGSGVVDKGSVTWKVENKRLVLLSAVQGLSCDYEVSGYELILNYDDEKSATFVKKEKMEEYEKKKAEEEKREAERIKKDDEQRIAKKKETLEGCKELMSEASKVLVSFESATLAALAELGSTYNKDDLIFEAPNDDKQLFIYEISNDIKTCKAEAKVDIGDFKKGDQIATMYDDRRGTFVHSSTNEAARKIIPEFFQDGMVTIRR